MKDPGTERNVQILLVYSTLVHLKRFTPQTPHQLAKMLTTNHNKWAFFVVEVNQSNTDKKNLKVNKKILRNSLAVVSRKYCFIT